ncbi:TetR/AcrR family transcriptional regulator [Mycobacterium shimoidei]|uniref:TetR family transcriptional regulator [Amycolatopsis mediterranei S699] n=1 Tax=Mycobacterium shimoidei TaxID=29313 RepID=A0A375YXA3_MYCSH|nr:TetR/AcrR family transcriptional regulator [Mycobacterium shimoidei]MCV7259314.1 TetR/AcrR family transcriptional regulator [Mycobacterium shimoidei]SRX93486.1 TetR family transcriptional regulator [Amycolatopsis mediterranei S699] [Mycobacterium shimoidei]
MSGSESAGAATSRSVDGRAARWSGQRERRRAEFVEAALQAIARYGPQTSTEQVAGYVGVTRTKLYRYFDGAADLHHSIARRASEMLIAAQRPVWNPTGRPIDMITHAVSRHLQWRVDHPNLYEYLTRHSLSDDDNGVAAIREVNNAVATNVTRTLEAYFKAVGLDESPVETLSFGVIGFVESAATHWLNNPAPLPLAEFAAQIAEWMWALLDKTLQSGGIHLDPHQPIAAPSQTP